MRPRSTHPNPNQMQHIRDTKKPQQPPLQPRLLLSNRQPNISLKRGRRNRITQQDIQTLLLTRTLLPQLQKRPRRGRALPPLRKQQDHHRQRNPTPGDPGKVRQRNTPATPRPLMPRARHLQQQPRLLLRQQQTPHKLPENEPTPEKLIHATRRHNPPTLHRLPLQNPTRAKRNVTTPLSEQRTEKERKDSAQDTVQPQQSSQKRTGTPRCPLQPDPHPQRLSTNMLTQQLHRITNRDRHNPHQLQRPSSHRDRQPPTRRRQQPTPKNCKSQNQGRHRCQPGGHIGPPPKPLPHKRRRSKQHNSNRRRPPHVLRPGQTSI